MKILMLNYEFPPLGGGGGVIFSHIAAELARRAGVSPLTIDRVEKGKACRMETKRKIMLALGYELSEKAKVFPED